MKTTFIYALCDPDTGGVRYVGKANDPRTRLNRDHLGAARQGKKTHLYNWIRSLLAQDKAPRLEVLFELPEIGWGFWEKYMIAGFKTEGHNLVNQTPGGEGGPIWLGRKQTPEHIEKRTAPRRGQKRTPEQLARMRHPREKYGPQSLQHYENRFTAIRHSGPGKNNSSGYKGVSPSGNGHWVATIQTQWLGTFNTPEEAAHARDAAARELWGNDCYLNFP